MIRSKVRAFLGLGSVLVGLCFLSCGGQTGMSAPSALPVADEGVLVCDGQHVVSPLELGLSLLDRSGSEGSVCFSPLSLRGALRMAADGAAGDTKQQLALVVGDWGHAALDTGRGGVELVEANAAWLDEGLELADAYADTLRERRGAMVSTLPLRQDAAMSADRINAWVKESTRGMIERLVSAADLPASTDLVLTNAVYFKGLWVEPFDASQVEEASFFGSGGERRVAMMHAQRRLRYWEDSVRQMVLLPYAGERYQMAIVLPKSGNSFGVLQGVSADTLAHWVSESTAVSVGLSLPRFRSSLLSDLSEAFQEMGLTLPFGGGADFSPMTGGANGLRIGSVLHHAVLEVSESGTEAAAATGVVMLRASLAQVDFRADRPFAFVLYDGDVRNALFVGRFDPR